MRRGYEVSLAVPPNLVAFVEAAGLGPALPYGVDSQKQIEADVFTNWWKVGNPVSVFRQARDYISDGWAQMNEALTTISEGADLILTGTTYQEVAANVAEYRHLPLAALHYFHVPPQQPHHAHPVAGTAARAGLVGGRVGALAAVQEGRGRAASRPGATEGDHPRGSPRRRRRGS